MGGVRKNWPVLFRGWLWFMAAFLTSLAEVLGEVLERDKWPSGPRVMLALLSAFGVGFIVLRSFYDGTAERHKVAMEKHENQKSVR